VLQVLQVLQVLSGLPGLPTSSDLPEVTSVLPVLPSSPASSVLPALPASSVFPVLPVLEEKNRHIRDENIEFIEDSHTYIVNKKETDIYTSVTTFIHFHFSKFDSDKIILNMMKGKNWNKNNKYWGMSPGQIKQSWDDNGKEQAGLGTQLHYDIECFMNIEIKENNLQIDYKHKDILEIYEFENPQADSKQTARVEWDYFLNFVRDYPDMQPYRTEMRIYDDKLKIAGSIDMIYKNDDGTFSIYDWKRSKGIETKNIYKKFSTTNCISHLPDLNFYHYSLQLNLYKYILEKNYNFKIKDLVLVQLHPNFGNYKLIQCLNLDKEIHDLILSR
jgi:ATP-dependent exoDNAse (exonuclease V) beta subunit